MNENIITESAVTLSNGFQSGQWVSFLEKTPEGLWKRVKKVSTGECTWRDDQSVDDMKVSLEGKGIVGGFHGDSPHSRLHRVKGFFGFTAEELAGPSPESGWSCSCVSFCAHDWRDVKTLQEYLIARFVDESFMLWSSMEDGVHTMPYEWGHQAAESYALVIDGKLLDCVTGCGDRTPYLTESDEKCVTDRCLYASCDMEDSRIEEEEHERKFWAAAEDIGCDEEYRSLCSAYPERQEELVVLKRKIETAVTRADSDARAKADETGILRRLLKHFRDQKNPLKSLRREKGGTWRFHRDFPGDVPESALIFQGDTWWVSWIK